MASWSMYEPVDSVSNHGSMEQMPGQMQMPQMQMPQMQNRNDHVAQGKEQVQPMNQIPHQMAAPPSNKQKGSVQVPQPPKKTVWNALEDISDFYQVTDWYYLFTAAILVEVFVVAITRFFPSFSKKFLNLWYSRFKWSAVIADVLSVMIGFGIARYIYTELIYPNNDWSPGYFTGTAVAVQVIHDILFYFGVIKPLPEGNNGMIDVMKSYSGNASPLVIAGDSVIMMATSAGAMLLKASSPHIVVAVALVSAYALPYFLETKNEFSGLS